VPLLSANTICNVPKLTTPTPTLCMLSPDQLKAEPFITPDGVIANSSVRVTRDRLERT